MTKPCSGCGGNSKPIYTDREDFWKWDPETEQYRMVDFFGKFYPLDTHDGCTEQQIVKFLEGRMWLATENDIIWRSVGLVFGAVLMAGLM